MAKYYKTLTQTQSKFILRVFNFWIFIFWALYEQLSQVYDEPMMNFWNNGKT